ncbi:hypothetical protein BJV82DRAFT_675644 [Fennellomyces sp. T-0311]|nr:hypothetical protein BJV82DRAFT_675644 [Fennellomyces sp. T-0311]
MGTTARDNFHLSDPSHGLSLPQHQVVWAALPSDIVMEIFSLLEQRDFLTCMAVCRDWYDFIPYCAKDVWAAVRFGVHDIRMENKRQIRCLGEHVKTVVLDTLAEDLYNLMNKLFEWGCTKIKTLELRSCVCDDQDEFLAAVSKLASRLTHMTMADQVSDVAFRQLLHSCPELTHFTFLGSKEGSWENFVEPEVRMELPATKQHTNIKYLCIDAAIDAQMCLKPILECCPNLYCFIGASWDDEPLIFSFGVYIDVALDPDIIFELCPKITHLQNTFSYNSTVNKLEYFDTSDQDGLRYFGQCEDTGEEATVQILTEHQSTLEHLCLRKFDPTERYYDWSPVFKSLQLPHLRVLDLGPAVTFSEDSLVTLLNHCPLIEELSWQECSFGQFDRSMIQSLRTLPLLRTFRCASFKLSPDVSLMTLFGRLPALEDFSVSFSQIPLTLPMTNQHANHLKRLHLKNIRILYDGNDLEDAMAKFFHFLAAHALELQELHFSYLMEPRVGSKWLNAIASIPTLKVCDIEINNTLPIQVEQDSMKQFLRLLKDTAIEQLKLYHLRNLSYEILDALGDLPLLTQFHNIVQLPI